MNDIFVCKLGDIKEGRCKNHSSKFCPYNFNSDTRLSSLCMYGLTESPKSSRSLKHGKH